MSIDVHAADELLTTTRAVRKRLDMNRPVSRQVVEECLTVAMQAPTGSLIAYATAPGQVAADDQRALDRRSHGALRIAARSDRLVTVEVAADIDRRLGVRLQGVVAEGDGPEGGNQPFGVERGGLRCAGRGEEGRRGKGKAVSNDPHEKPLWTRTWGIGSKAIYGLKKS